MTATIFLTGASGYLGGEALYQLAQLKRPIRIRSLVRDAEKGANITKAFPNVEIVQGDLDDSSLIEREAGNADVVLHLASTKHEVSSRAIAAGLAKAQREKPGCWIQISGASMFSTPEIKANTYGQVSEKRYDDVADLKEVVEVIRSSPARVVDNLVLDQDSAKVRTALIPGPLIYGTGRGPINTRSIQGPESARYALQNGHAFVVGDGQAAWSNVHVSDVGGLLVLLTEAALDGRQGLWNQDGIFFPENGLLTFGDISKRIAASAAQAGLISSNEVKSVSPEEANQITGHGAVLLGTNARVQSSRARQDLGWKPSGHSLEDEIPKMVEAESKRMKAAA